MKQPEYEVITGSVEHIAVTKEDTGFTVLDLNLGEEIICVVGVLPGVEVGEELKLTGYYQTHPNFGQQFKAELCERHLPASAHAIFKYLSSGALKGIGPALARRIVDKFGEDTFLILEKEPKRLSEISGISPSKADKLAEEFKRMFGVRTLMAFLAKYQIPPMQSIEIWKKWGEMAQDLIATNPYLLTEGEIGVDFKTADAIAKDHGLPHNCSARIHAALNFVLTFNLQNGHTGLPRTSLISTAAVKLLALEEEQVINALEDALQEGSLYSRHCGSVELIFLPNYYMAQKYITSRLKDMLQVHPVTVAEVETAISAIEQADGITYEQLQRRAIAQAVRENVFILTGGPGTGKTTTVNAILSILEQRGLQVVLAAPTGRAANRLSQVTGREAKTVHRLLEVQVGFAKTGKLEFVHNGKNPLSADAVIVDEMSMVDTLLFDALLRGMKPSAKLIMVGDFHQLPSVGAGNLLRDFMESDVIPTVELTHIFRQAAKSLIVTNAHAIVRGELPDMTRKDNDFFFLSASNPVAAGQTVAELCAVRLPKTYGFSPFGEIQVLCPQRKGELGTVALNQRLQEALNPKAPQKAEWKSGLYTFRMGDKVMQIKNNYDIEWQKNGEVGMGIFNGDIGVIKMLDRGSQTMGVEFDQRMAYYSFDLANEQLELAYAVTVHKSQGNEFEAVILPVLGGYDKLYFRNLLYTAVTRAKKILILIGSKERIAFMVQNNRKMLRYTGLKAMLQDHILGDGMDA